MKVNSGVPMPLVPQSVGLDTNRTPFSWQEFAEAASNELRSPLALIHGYIETLQEAVFKKTNSLQRCLEVMDKHSRRMMRILDDIQTLARLDSQTGLERRVELFHAHRSFEDALEHLSPLIDLLHPTIHTSFPPQDLVTGDRRLWDMVLVHLLETALARNPSGNLSLEVTCSIEAENITVIIADNGIGFPAEDVLVLFKPFHHPQNDAVDQLKGSGLGLAIVERSVAALGGTISVSSRPGCRTEFVVKLPKMAISTTAHLGE